MKANIYPIKTSFLIPGEVVEMELNLSPQEFERIMDYQENNVFVMETMLNEISEIISKKESRAKCLTDEDEVITDTFEEDYNEEHTYYPDENEEINDIFEADYNPDKIRIDPLLEGYLFECVSLTGGDGRYYLHAHILERVIVSDVVNSGGYNYGTYNDFPWEINMPEESRKKIVKKMLCYLKEIHLAQLTFSEDELEGLGFDVERCDSDYLRKYEKTKDHVGMMKLIKEISVSLPIEDDYVCRLMQCDSERECVKLVYCYVRNCLEVKRRLVNKIDDRYREILSHYNVRSNLKNLRTHLKNQLHFVDGELKKNSREICEISHLNPSGEGDCEYAQKVEACEMPEKVKAAAMKEVDRLSRVSKDNSEYYKICEYLNFMLALPWKREKEKDFNIKNARITLDEHHYGLEKVKSRILQQLAVQQLKKGKKGSVLLLVGPPGVGKTTIARSVAKAMGREYVRLSLGGVSEEADIRGFQRTYVGSKSGRMLECMKAAGTSNPVVVLDEIDKMSAYKGDPAAAMLEVLDPDQNNTFTDRYLNLPYDLSDVFFIATANEWYDIPVALRDRMEAIEVSSYTSDEKFHIASNHLYRKTLKENGLTSKQLQITEDAIKSIINDYTFEAGVRDLQRKMKQICLVVSEKVVSKSATLPIIIDAPELEEILGDKSKVQDTIQSYNPPGVVTGLATSQGSGGIMFIEAIKMPGTGQVIFTGQLGDVMRESVDISRSLLRSRVSLEGINFQELDLHIHFPQGAIPKDGPSAGVATFTALASLITGRKVEPTIAMTGELTLSGRVLAVGGVKEKLLGASRAGITKVLIPKANVKDLKDIPDEVKKQLEIVVVETVDEVLKETLKISIAAPKIVSKPKDLEEMGFAS